MFYIILYIVSIIIFAKLLNLASERENARLKARLYVIEKKRAEERKRYEERVYLMNDTINILRDTK